MQQPQGGYRHSLRTRQWIHKDEERSIPYQLRCFGALKLIMNITSSHGRKIRFKLQILESLTSLMHYCLVDSSQYKEAQTPSPLINNTVSYTRGPTEILTNLVKVFTFTDHTVSCFERVESLVSSYDRDIALKRQIGESSARVWW